MEYELRRPLDDARRYLDRLSSPADRRVGQARVAKPGRTIMCFPADVVGRRRLRELVPPYGLRQRKRHITYETDREGDYAAT